MCSCLLPASGDFVSSRLLRSFSSGRNELPLLAEDIVAILFYRLLFLTCSLLLFFFTRTSAGDCMDEKRALASWKEALPLSTDMPRLDCLLTGLLPSERPRTMRGEAISRIFDSRLFGSSSFLAFWRTRYLRFMLKKLREQGSVSWRTRMMLKNISDVMFWLMCEYS